MRTCTALLSLIVVCSSTGALAAPLLDVVGTNANGDPAGTPDPHYTLTAAPAGAGTTAIATTTFETWLPLDNWISTSVDAIQPVGDYEYTLEFDLTGFDPSTAIIKGTFASDDVAAIYLNGVFRLDNGVIPTWNRLTDFLLDDGFRTGLNTLQFRVNQLGPDFPTGLLVNIDSATATPGVGPSPTPTPEPTSLALWGLLATAGGLGVVGRRR